MHYMMIKCEISVKTASFEGMWRGVFWEVQVMRIAVDGFLSIQQI